MKRARARAASVVKQDVDRLSFLIPVELKRRLQAKLIMDQTTWTDLARAIAMAYLADRKIVIDGKPIQELLEDQ